MKLTPILVSLLLFSALPSFAAVYECIDRNGNRTYTSDRRAHCRDANLGRPSVYTSAPTVAIDTAAPPPEAPSEPTAANNHVVATAEQNLRNAIQALEAGKQVRYGNERNYVRYQERIQGLENEVAKRQAELEQALGNGTSAPSGAPLPGSGN